MKKLFLYLLLLFIAMPMSAGRVLETRGDTVLIARDGDTLRFTGAQAINELASILDDTIVNINEGSTAKDMEVHSGTRELAIKSQQIWADVATDSVVCFVWGMVFLIFVILLFSYLKRRRKYKMVEKAIENNYPLPPYVFDGAAPQFQHSQQVVRGVPIVEGTPVEPVAPVVDENGEVVPPPFTQTNDAWSSQAPVTGTPRINWRAFSSSFTMIAVGLGLMIMFHETPFLMGVFVIVLLIGLGKAFIEYQDQSDAIKTWRERK